MKKMMIEVRLIYVILGGEKSLEIMKISLMLMWIRVVVERGDDERSDENSHGQQAEDHNEMPDVDRSQSGGKFMRSFEYGDDVDNNLEMSRCDILGSPCPSGQDKEGTHIPNYDFHAMDLKDPVLDLRMKFPNIYMFREAVKEFNVRRGKNIRFLKNERRKCIVVCKDPKCYYRVYA